MPYSDLNNGTGRIYLYTHDGSEFLASAPNEGPNYAFRQCVCWLVVNYPKSTVWINAGYGPNTDEDKGADAEDITSDLNSRINTLFTPV